MKKVRVLVGENAHRTGLLADRAQQYKASDIKARTEAGRASMPRCTYIIKGWKQCEGPATVGSFCVGHSPEYGQKRVSTFGQKRDVVATVAKMSQEWVTPYQVAQELEDTITPQAGRLLADAARDGLIERRRIGQRIVYRIRPTP